MEPRPGWYVKGQYVNFNDNVDQMAITNSNNMQANRLYSFPMTVWESVQVSSIMFSVGSTGTRNMRLGIYDVESSVNAFNFGHATGDPLGQTSELTITTSGIHTAPLSCSLSYGFYRVGVWFSATTWLHAAAYTQNDGFNASGSPLAGRSAPFTYTAGPLPSPGGATVWTDFGGNIPSFRYLVD